MERFSWIFMLNQVIAGGYVLNGLNALVDDKVKSTLNEKICVPVHYIFLQGKSLYYNVLRWRCGSVCIWTDVCTSVPGDAQSTSFTSGLMKTVNNDLGRDVISNLHFIYAFYKKSA